jgi:hypothetical protein
MMVSMKRKRGGQPGNLNALKHGFYSKQFEPAEIQDLETRLLEGLQDEVAMLRVMMRRIMELTKGCDDLEELMNVVGVLGLAATQLAGLLRVQHLLGGDENSEIARTISRAISNVSKEMGLSI